MYLLKRENKDPMHFQETMCIMVLHLKSYGVVLNSKTLDQLYLFLIKVENHV